MTDGERILWAYSELYPSTWILHDGLPVFNGILVTSVGVWGKDSSGNLDHDSSDEFIVDR